MGTPRPLFLGLLAAIAGTAAAQAPGQSGHTAEERGVFIAEVRQAALAYTARLPDFLCTQVTHRSSAVAQSHPPVWKPRDTLTIRLTYFEKKENYRVIRVNEKAVDKSLSQMPGWKTMGDFGGMLRDIFAPEHHAQFDWTGGDVWNGRPVAVLAFSIDRQHSPFRSTAQKFVLKKSANWAAKGVIYADRETRRALHVAVDGINNPDSPTQDVHLVLDYAEQPVGDHWYLLPSHSVSIVNVSGTLLKNESQFTEYRKFSADSDIRFLSPPGTERGK